MIALGINIFNLRGGGSSGPNGAPNNLVLTVKSDTEIDATCDINATNADGVSWEISTDLVNWTVSTTASGAKNFTGLTSGVKYYIRPRNYKGDLFSDYATIKIAITYTSEFITTTTGLTTPLTDVERPLLNEFIYDLKSALGVSILSDAGDLAYLTGGETLEVSLRNLISSSYAITLQGTPAPVHTPYQGLLSDGVHGYGKTGYNPSINGSKFTKNSASLGAYSRTQSATGVQSAIGCYDGTNAAICAFSSPTIVGRVNQTNAAYTGTIVTKTTGLISISRTASNIITSYQHGFGTQQKTTSSSALPNAEFYVLAENQNGTVANYDKKQEAFIWCGRGLTQTEVDGINEALTKYLTAHNTCIWTDIWTRYGSLGIAATSGEPSIIYDTDPQILTQYTHVFKMWYLKDWANSSLNYAESPTGLPDTWVTYNGNPVLVNAVRNYVYKYNGIYYLTCVPYSSPTTINLYSSVNGITFTLLHANIIGLGASGQWDGLYLANTCIWVEGDTMYMLYDGKKTGLNIWQTGLATAALADLSTWTKSGSNPVLGGGTRTMGGTSVVKIGSTYWAWVIGTTGATVLPTDIYRFSSTDLAAWTMNPTGKAFVRKTDDEGATSVVGQVTDPLIIEVNAKCYLFYAGTSDGSLVAGAYHLRLAIANMTLAELVATSEENL